MALDRFARWKPEFGRSYGIPATFLCSKSGGQSTNNGTVGWQAEMDVLQDVS